MKKLVLSLIMALATTCTMAASEAEDVSVNQAPQLESSSASAPALNVAQLLGISESTLSEELQNVLAWNGGIPNRPHFIFPNLQQCLAIPECVCEPYNGMWGCFIE
jgi:hypothetical protein